MTVHGQPAKVGVFGGTFDPPQNGHIAVAQAVFDRLHLDLVLFVPAGDPWQKQEHSSAEDRFKMVNLAIQDIDKFAVSTADIDRGGPTYSVDTLRDVAAEFPNPSCFSSWVTMHLLGLLHGKISTNLEN